jgi:hypothetical protein
MFTANAIITNYECHVLSASTCLIGSLRCLEACLDNAERAELR